MKRKDYINYDEMFMGIAAIASFRSKDPSTQHGCVIVNNNNRIVSIGYNGFPDKCSDDIFPWDSPTKYDYSEHAERNAIYNAETSLEGCRLYLYSEKGYYPCSDCARAIIQKKISEVILAFVGDDTISQSGTYHWDPTKRMFAAANIRLTVMQECNKSFINISNKFQMASLNIK